MRLSWKLQSPHWVDDGDFNKNGKKVIGLDWQNNNSAGVSRSFVHFIAVTAWQGKRIRLAKQQFWECITPFCTFLCRHCTTTTWKCLLSRFVEEMDDNDFLFSFPERQLAHFRVPPGHLYQNEVKFWAFDIEMMFHSQANTNSFSQERLCTWPHFESEDFWNSEMSYSTLQKFQHLTYGSRWNKHDKVWCHFFSDVFIAVAVVVA